MPIFPWKRLVQLPVVSCMLYSAAIIAVVQIFTHGEYDYEHIPRGIILTQLYKKTIPDLPKKNKPECTYDRVLSNTETLQNWQVLEKTYDDFNPKGIVNGSYTPEHCNPTISVAILVTYRNRQKNLDVFLPYMHDFLRAQDIHYKIFIIEQQDEKPWNKGLLYNIGARFAIAERFPCLFLHDVDLVPLDRGNLYACSRAPRHASAALDRFRFVLPYAALAGGALALPADHYIAAGGFSNRFLDWGGEDDDFEHRLRVHHLDIVRYPRTLSRYTMLQHERQTHNRAVHRILRENRAHPDPGYTQAGYSALHVTRHRLFTLLAVQL